MLLLLVGVGIGSSYAYELQADGNLKSSNLLDISESNFTSGKWLNLSNGQVEDDSDYYWVSNYIAIPDDIGDYGWFFSLNFHDDYLNYPDRNFVLCKYSENYSFDTSINLSLENQNKFTFYIGSYAKYFRVCIAFDTIDESKSYDFMLNMGNSRYLPYEPYGEVWYSKDKYETIAQQNVQLQNDYALLQKRLNLYNEYVIYGWGAFIDSLWVVDTISDTRHQLSKDDLINNGWLVDNSLKIPDIINSMFTNTANRFRLSFSFIDDFSLPFWYLLAVAKTDLSMSCTLVGSGGKEYAFKISYYPNDVNLGSNYEDVKNVIGNENIKGLIITGDGVDSFSDISTGNNDTISFDSGYSSGYQEGYNKGSEDGNKSGYDKGLADGDSSPLLTLFNAVLNAPINIFRQVFNFDLFGVNIYGLCTSLLTFALIIWLIKRFL